MRIGWTVFRCPTQSPPNRSHGPRKYRWSLEQRRDKQQLSDHLFQDLGFLHHLICTAGAGYEESAQLSVHIMRTPSRRGEDPLQAGLLGLLRLVVECEAEKPSRPKSC